MKKAFFFDRDGVLSQVILRRNADGKDFENWPVNADELKIVEEASKVINYVKINGYIPIVLTNQRGVYDGAMTMKNYEAITKKLCDALEIQRSQVFECLHGREAGCFCRKPKPGLFLMAKGMYDIDLENSWMVGDSESDIQAAYGAGVLNTLFIRRLQIPEVQLGNKNDEEKVNELAKRNVNKPKIINSLSEILSLDILKPELIG